MNNWYTLIVALALVGAPVRGTEPAPPVQPPKGIALVELKLDEAAAGGFVLPGSRVDVVFKATAPKTTVILEDLLVYVVETDAKTFAYSVGMTKTQSLVVAPLIKDKVKPQIILRAPDKK